MPPAFDACARCGHTPGGCAHCGVTDPFLGGNVDGVDYCHTFSPNRPTCYESESRAHYDRLFHSPEIAGIR
jgi:hypothetical protein